MINLKYVTDLDKNDPLARYLDEFVREDKTLCYLDGNSLGRLDRKSTRLNSSHSQQSRMPSSA